MIPTSGANESNPTHHVTLSDGANTVGLMLITPGGLDDPKAISEYPYPRQSTKIGSGSSKYEDYIPPYMASVQDSLIAGRGADIFDDDKTKFADSYRLVTTLEKNVMLGPLDLYSKGDVPRDQDYYLEDDDSGATNGWLALYGSTRFAARSFVAGSNYSANIIEFRVRRVGTPGIGTVSIRADAAGDPGATGTSWAFLQPSEVPDIVTTHIYKQLGASRVLAAGTTYWVSIDGDPGDNAANHWEVWCRIGAVASTSNKTSADGATWASDNECVYFRVCEAMTTDEAEGYFFDYKGLKYFVTKGGVVLRNGTRGVALGTSTTTAIDTAVAMTAGQYSGAVLIITKGVGSEETQPYRRIFDNLAGQFQFTTSTAWLLAPNTTSEYIVKDTDYWSSVATLPQTTVKGVAVADEVVYFAHGRGKPVTYMYEYNNAGTWTVATGSDDLTDIDHIIATRHPTDSLVLWAARNDHPTKGAVVFKNIIPPRPGKTFRKHGTLYDNTKIWNRLYLSGVTQNLTNGHEQISIGAGVAANSIVASQIISPVDLTGSNRILFSVKSSIAQGAGDLVLTMADRELSRAFTPDYLYSSMRQVPPDSIFFYDDSGSTAADDYRPHAQGSWDVPSAFKSRYMKINAMQSADAIAIGCAERFDRLDIDLSAVVNNNASTLTVEYWQGTQWVAVSGLSDGTASGGATMAVDGAITWTYPTDWQKGVQAGDASTYMNTSLFWVRIKTNNALDDIELRIRARYTGESGATLESLQYKDLAIAKDGDVATELQAFMWDTLGYLYVGFSELFSNITFNLGTAVNNNNSALSGEYFDGEAWASVSVLDGTVTGIATMTKDGSVTFVTPEKWKKNTINGVEDYWIRLKVSADLDAIDFKEITVKQDAIYSLSLPALVANEDTWVSLAFSHDTAYLLHPDLSKITHFGLKYTRAAAAATIDFTSPIFYGAPSTFEDEGVIPCGNSTEKILALEAYGDERQNCWVLKEGSVGEIQAENNDAYVPIPLQEIGSLYSSDNARGHTTNDVYMYWTMGGLRVQRYYNRTLENVGPDKGEGMPSTRQGTIRQLLSMPGAVYAGVDGGVNGVSSVLVRANSGWHEIYRFPTGQRFWRMGLDVVPDNAPSRLWIACGRGDIKYIQVSKINENPSKDSSMRYTGEGTFISGWVSQGFLDLEKLNSFLTINSKGLVAGAQQITVDYQLETGAIESGWTEIGTFSTSPWQQRAVSAAYNVKGRLFRLRFRLTTTSTKLTPILKAWILDEVMRFPVKYAYTIRFRVRDNDVDLRGVADPTSRAEDKVAALKAWSTALTVLTFRNSYSPMDNKSVVIEPIGGKPIDIIVRDKMEYLVYEATLLEV